MAASLAGSPYAAAQKPSRSPRTYDRSQSMGSASKFVSHTDSQTPTRNDDVRCLPNVISKQMSPKYNRHQE